MKVLFIGGTGTISSACTRLAAARGIDLTLLNRGQGDRPIPAGVRVVRADIRRPDTVQAALARERFDVVVDWIAFTPAQIETDLALFRGRVGQYIFISSASAYQTPPARLPVTESTPLDNPVWGYSQAKIGCEERLLRAYREEKFPVTIVRPSHTYDERSLPMYGRYTIIDRMRRGQKVVVHGDGSSLWVLTHHEDFARGFVGLLGHSGALGEAVHITSDEWLTWNQIFQILGRAAGVEPRLVHLPSAYIAAYDQDWGESLRGDKTHSMLFDNSKIRRLVPDFVATIPFARGAEQIIAWYDADPARRTVDPAVNQLLDRMISAYEAAWPAAGAA